MKQLKPKECKVCTESFTPFKSTQRVCSVDCAIVDAKNKKKKEVECKQKAIEKEARKINREAKERVKTRSKRLSEAQSSFNAYVRGRDVGSNCISCGKSEAELKINNPIAMVCGHYLSVGAYPELRFNSLNAHLQCTRCNGGAGKYGQFNSKGKTVTKEYRINLIKKIGLEKVEWLEGQQLPQNLTHEDIDEIKIYYREQLKLLKG